MFVRRIVWCIVVIAVLQTDAAQPGESTSPSPETPTKLDDGLAGRAAARRAVFVRMKDQLLPRGGDYEQFAAAHTSDRRAVLRKYVLDTLHRKSDQSWSRVRGAVEKLVGGGAIQQLQRYWIVNGFAAVATGQACRRLAELDDVEFIYTQKGIALQQRAPAQRPPALPRQTQARRQIYVTLLEQWKDDSDAPFSADGLTIPWNIRKIKADQVWHQEHVHGRGVVIALQDSGLMVVPALTHALRRNSAEKLDGRDDDGNGYIDDLFGFDVARDSYDVLGDGQMMTHGSMCAGIIAGRPLNKKRLATGIAPRAKLMVVRGMGRLRAYEYAFANGADIISMSYMMTQPNLGNFRGLFRLAHEHMAAGGLLGVGGAGNFGPGGRPALPQGHQIALPKDIPCVIAAAGILETGQAPVFSSRGPCWWNDVRFYKDYPPDKPLQKLGCHGLHRWLSRLGAARPTLASTVDHRVA